jgi:hypothetical protein
MISINNNSLYLQNALSDAGLGVYNLDGNWYSKNDKLSQDIIDSFEPLHHAKLTAKNQVKSASAQKRLKYITQAAGKDAEYKTKEAEAAEYEINGTIGVFMQARMDKTGEGSIAVGLEWSAKALSWKAIGAEIAAIEDKAGMDIDACTNWTLCESIVQSAIDSFDLI